MFVPVIQLNIIMPNQNAVFFFQKLFFSNFFRNYKIIFLIDELKSIGSSCSNTNECKNYINQVCTSGKCACDSSYYLTNNNCGISTCTIK